MNNRNKLSIKYAVVFVSFMLMSKYAYALPWEAALTTLQTSLTGPVAKAMGVIAMAITGAMLAFGGELSEFAKRMCMVVLALAVMLLANAMITGLGLGGA